MVSKHQLFLHTGSNLGDRHQHLLNANRFIVEEIGEIINASNIYNTKAWGITDQPDFLNQALELQTHLSPQDVLERILAIEKKMGRQREIKWGQRLIDIDILFYDDLIIDTPNLTIPHPYLHYRNFVLKPLVEIAPDFKHPLLEKTVMELNTGSIDDLYVTQTDLL